MELERLSAEVDVLRGTNAAIYVVLMSLIAKHPDHHQLQLHLASVVEFAEHNLWAHLSEKQAELARQCCWQLQQVVAAPGEIDPMSFLRSGPQSGG